MVVVLVALGARVAEHRSPRARIWWTPTSTPSRSLPSPVSRDQPRRSGSAPVAITSRYHARARLRACAPACRSPRARSRTGGGSPRPTRSCRAATTRRSPRRSTPSSMARRAARRWASSQAHPAVVVHLAVGAEVVVERRAGLVHVERRWVVALGHRDQRLPEAVGLDRPAAVGDRSRRGDELDVGGARPLGGRPVGRRARRRGGRGGGGSS